MSKIIKIISRIERALIKEINNLNVRVYMKCYTHWLQRQGVDICEYLGVGYIDPSAYIDGADFEKIHIGKCVTISKNVIILTHDYTIWTAMNICNKGNDTKRQFFSKDVRIGDNCFVGANVVILPGTTIGDNCIIGAGAVVKGKIPNNTIWIGNPARQVMTIEEFTERHLEMQDFIQID